MDRRQFLTSLAVAASGKQLVLTEGRLDAPWCDTCDDFHE